MPCVIFQKVPIHGSPEIAKKELIQNLELCNDILPINIEFLQNNLSVQDAKVELGTIKDKQELIKNSPFEYYFNGDPIPVKLYIVESYKK